MSTNCTRCGKRPRVDPSLMCAVCQEVDFNNECARVEMTYPEVKEFFDTWASHCGASRKTFIGHTVKMLTAFYHQSKLMDVHLDEDKPAKPLELMQALCPKLEEDFLMALRFLYYVKTASVVPDARYDEAEADYINRPEVEDSPLMNPGSSLKDSYPDHVQALAFYLSIMGWNAGQKAGKS